jgi:phage terminase large subunit
MILTIKQTRALDLLESEQITEGYYGGAAGGGKTKLGCYWQLKRRFKYPATRGLLGRAKLKTLKETTLQTFFETAKEQGVKRGVHFDLTSSQDKEFPNCLVFENDSLIYLKDLFAYPSDPEFDELGSLEITDAFIDEAPQVTAKAKNIVKSRMRYKLVEYDDDGKLLWKIKPKLLMAGNPSKGWPYSEFYKAAKDGTLEKHRAFIQALPKDNKHLPDSYIETLLTLDKNSRERLAFGNWEYDDDPDALCDYDKIVDIFTNDFPELDDGKFYITADVARLGSDKIVIGLWKGWRCIKIWVFEKKRITESYELIKEIKNQYNVPTSNIICDEDGVGGGLVDLLGCNGFVNNSRALPDPTTPMTVNNGKSVPENYENLQAQCCYRLARRVNKNGLYVCCEDVDVVEDIKQDLEYLKSFQRDKDGKKKIMPKDKVKENIGRSPDYRDMIMMREWFDLRAIEANYMISSTGEVIRF